MKIYIRAMGTPKSEIQHELTHVSGELTDHLVKLYLYPNSEYRNHWKTEIYSFLPRCPKLKSTNKFPNAAFIKDCISAYLDQTESIMNFLTEEYSDLVPERYDAAKLEGMLDTYFSWISEELSKNGRVHSSTVYNKLDEIGF